MSLNRELSEEINKNNLSDAGNWEAVQYALQLFLEIKKECFLFTFQTPDQDREAFLSFPYARGIFLTSPVTYSSL